MSEEDFYYAAYDMSMETLGKIGKLLKAHELRSPPSIVSSLWIPGCQCIDWYKNRDDGCCKICGTAFLFIASFKADKLHQEGVTEEERILKGLRDIISPERLKEMNKLFFSLSEKQTKTLVEKLMNKEGQHDK